MSEEYECELCEDEGIVEVTLRRGYEWQVCEECTPMEINFRDTFILDELRDKCKELNKRRLRHG